MRLVRRIVWGLVAAVALVIVAWLVTNWNDAPPVPRPPELALPQPTLPDERNAYFVLAGLHAAADRDPAQAGLAQWKHALDMSPKVAMEGAAAVGQDRHEPQAAPERLPGLSGDALVCTSSRDCAEHWIDNAAAALDQRSAHGAIGRRCDAIAAAEIAFEEVLAPMRNTAEPMAVHATGALACSTWFASGAVLAWARGDREAALEALGKSDRFARAMLSNSHSLIGQMIAIKVARRHLNALASLAVRDARLAERVRPMLASWPDAAASAKRWMAVEAAFLRGWIEQVSRESDRTLAAHGDDGPDMSDRFLARLYLHRIGWHPERTVQRADAHWVQAQRGLNDGLPAAIRSQAGLDAGPVAPLVWRNTLGHMAFAVSAVDYTSYLARQADLELYREAVVAAVEMAATSLPSQQRTQALAKRTPSAITQGRLSFDADGRVLSARTWSKDQSTGFDENRDGIRIAWPP